MTNRSLPPAAMRSMRRAFVLPLLLAAALPSPAAAQSAPAGPVSELSGELRRLGDSELLGVYAARGYRPVWLTPAGALAPGAERVAELVETAAIDGVDPTELPVAELSSALEQLRREATPAARVRAELALSRAFVDYVRAVRRAPAAAMTYEHASLRPNLPRRADALWAAASAASLDDYVSNMRWMHPLYAPLRRAALVDGGDMAGIDPAVRTNLARIRALPALGKGRTILVDAATATLWMYEGNRAVDSMRVVVGKPTLQTPMLAGYVRYAILNPYWNVPQDLVRANIAPNVLRRGVGYLKASGYEVLSGWGSDAAPIEAAKVDWRQIARGDGELRVRQLPGDGNFMGEVKFEFPNPLGIYLHDTPDKHLLREDQRQFSSGCIRLEDAQRLGRWLMQGPLQAASDAPEQRIDLPEIVPIYVTYLTVRPEAGRLAFGPDPYDRDGVSRALAQSQADTGSLVR